eukprot:IDg17998t1
MCSLVTDDLSRVPARAS